jgi:hypothetical protein
MSSTPGQTVQALTKRWQELCSHYLPYAPDNSLWRYNQPPRSDMRPQGWKLHVSATLLNAHKTLQKIAPLLVATGVQFKAPASLQEVGYLNSGVHYDYTQVGKIVTVYPHTDQDAVALARRLHALTRGLTGPVIPFDLRFRPNSNVYYRYGAFRTIGEDYSIRVIQDHNGVLVPDLPDQDPPAWVHNPFREKNRERDEKAIDNPLQTSFRVLRALTQRGKGGVYQAIDMRADQPRLCLLKEGRRAGELNWAGKDGRWRVKREGRVLSMLRERGIDVPRVYSCFEVNGDYYLVLEFIDGENFQAFLHKQKRLLSVTNVLKLSIQLANLIAKLHRVGWVWRDCKPANLVLTKAGKLRSLDFESAHPIHESKPITWSTPGFSPTKEANHVISGVDDDLYALGAIIYLLMAGRLPQNETPVSTMTRRRRNIPQAVCRIVSELLNVGGKTEIDADLVARDLSVSLCTS